ncbi:MAG: lipid-binding SYLF domain-containing protein [Acidobacteriota bacterium]
MSPRLVRIVFALIACGSLSFAAEATHRLSAAVRSIQEVMNGSDRTIPQELMARAQCVVVVPNLKKGAFFLGGKYGRGFVSCRKPDGVGWSAPGSVRIEGGTFGLQVGAAESDVFLLVMNQRGMDSLLRSKFTLGGEASIALGPLGRSTQAETDAFISAEILTWSRSRGLFLGVSLDGATLREDADWNYELYGKTITNREVLTSAEIAVPAGADALLTELNRYSSRR